MSELKQDFQKNSVDSLNLFIKKHFWLNYSELTNTYISLQIWVNSKLSINELLGHSITSFYNLANGSVKREFSLYKESSSGKKQTTKVCFRIILQEKWKFKLNFLDFRANNIVNVQNKPVNCFLKIQLSSHGFTKNEVSSDISKMKKNPVWENLNGQIKFVGTFEELEEKDLTLFIYEYGNFKNDLLASENISLKGVLDSQSIRVPMRFMIKEKMR